MPHIIGKPIELGRELLLDMSSDSQHPTHETEALQTNSQAGLHAEIGCATSAAEITPTDQQLQVHHFPLPAPLSNCQARSAMSCLVKVHRGCAIWSQVLLFTALPTSCQAANTVAAPHHDHDSVCARQRTQTSACPFNCRSQLASLSAAVQHDDGAACWGGCQKLGNIVLIAD